jgi:hypothetical protein
LEEAGIAKDTTKQHYTDFIIDGVVAKRNLPSNSREHFMIPGFPTQADTKNIWQASWRMSHQEITEEVRHVPRKWMPGYTKRAQATGGQSTRSFLSRTCQPHRNRSAP